VSAGGNPKACVGVIWRVMGLGGNSVFLGLKGQWILGIGENNVRLF